MDSARISDPQVLHRNMVVTAPGPSGPLTVAGNPIKFAGVDDPSTRGAPPELDEHRAEILRWLDDA